MDSITARMEVTHQGETFVGEGRAKKPGTAATDAGNSAIKKMKAKWGDKIPPGPHVVKITVMRDGTKFDASTEEASDKPPGHSVMKVVGLISQQMKPATFKTQTLMPSRGALLGGRDPYTS